MSDDATMPQVVPPVDDVSANGAKPDAAAAAAAATTAADIPPRAKNPVPGAKRKRTTESSSEYSRVSQRDDKTKVRVQPKDGVWSKAVEDQLFAALAKQSDDGKALTEEVTRSRDELVPKRWASQPCIMLSNNNCMVYGDKRFLSLGAANVLSTADERSGTQRAVKPEFELRFNAMDYAHQIMPVLTALVECGHRFMDIEPVGLQKLAHQLYMRQINTASDDIAKDRERRRKVGERQQIAAKQERVTRKEQAERLAEERRSRREAKEAVAAANGHETKKKKAKSPKKKKGKKAAADSDDDEPEEAAKGEETSDEDTAPQPKKKKSKKSADATDSDEKEGSSSSSSGSDSDEDSESKAKLKEMQAQLDAMREKLAAATNGAHVAAAPAASP